MKKLTSILIALVAAFAFIGSTFAATTTGTITINGTTAGKQYGLYKIFDVTYDDENDKVAYTINENWESFFKNAGAEFLSESNNTEGTLSMIIVDDEELYINITNDNIAEFASLAHDYSKGLTADKVADASATGTTTTVSSLPLGYYLVFPYGATQLKDGQKSIVSINTMKPNATVNVKAEYPDITKEADKVSVEVGETVTFTLTGEVPDVTGYVKYVYKFWDSMTEGLTFDGMRSIKVTIGGEEYTSFTTESNGNGFKLSIDVLTGVTNKTFAVGDEIVVTYTATVNKHAIKTIEVNTAKLEYQNNPKEGTEFTPDHKTYNYSTNLEILKVDSESKETKLAGAKFVLLNSDGKFYKAVMDGDKLVNVEWVAKVEDATVVITDENGAASFEGLADGSYSLRETKAPAGYNRLTKDVEVVINGKGETELSAITETTTIVSATSTVPNTSGSVLPETGGIGTKLFVTIGLILSLGTALVLVTNKRMAKEVF